MSDHNRNGHHGQAQLRRRPPQHRPRRPDRSTRGPIADSEFLELPDQTGNHDQNTTAITPASNTSPVAGNSERFFTLRLGNHRNPVTLKPAELDAQKLGDILGQVVKSRTSDGVEIAANELTLWNETDRTSFWQLIKVLTDASIAVELIIDGARFCGTVEFAVQSLLTPTTDPLHDCRVRELVCAALSQCYSPVDRGVIVDRIVGDLRKFGSTTMECKEVKADLKRRLRHRESRRPQPGTHLSESSTSPCALAEQFLNKSYAAFEEDAFAALALVDIDAEPSTRQTDRRFRLRYYDESFYRRNKDRWVAVSVEQIRLEIALFLQLTTPDKTSAKHVGDVLVNVKALCVLCIEGTPPLPFDLDDRNRKLLAFPNGVLDLTAIAEGSAPEMLPSEYAWFSSNVLPYEFDSSAKCPRFKKFLAEVFDVDARTGKPRSQGDRRYSVFQEMMGYLLLSDNRLQKFFVLVGSGRNGKGTLTDVIQEMIGVANVANVPLEAMGQHFGHESLVGKMANICGDMSEIDNAMEGPLKMWTGEDRVTVFRKHKSPIEVMPTLKFVFSTNQLPWFRDRSDGIWRRMIVIPFTFAVRSDEESDPNLRAALRQELPGILNFALRGLARLLKNGRFTACAICRAAAEKHRADANPVRQFIRDNFTFATDYAGEQSCYQWETNTREIADAIKHHNTAFGDSNLKPNIVCRALNNMPGVTDSRPTTRDERNMYGRIYHGVCLGEPVRVLPRDKPNAENNTTAE